MESNLLAFIVLVPLAGAAILGLLGKRMNERQIGIIACGTIGISTVLALYVFFGQLLRLPVTGDHPRLVTQYLFNWIHIGTFSSDFAYMVDPLSGIMVVFVTFVAFWIHVFATGYMHGEDGYYRFFAYLNLFMFAMLTLILADNLLLLFVGWEGVGLCSYLLIGYYFLKDFANDAAKKAFVVNRIGDLGFALGIMLIYKTFGSISFIDKGAVKSFLSQVHIMPADPFGWGLLFAGGLTCIAFLLFIGAVGKSAQIPLFVWLPDAMAGPTPVSALIHAATMVTAGVYMVTRTSEIYAHAPTAMFIVAVIGAATAIFAATIGLGQWDIKKVLAYSTVSQLGYMFLACGVGAWGAAIFHVFTHAFFKAQLFLGSGSVIHGMHDEQDMRWMGGLKKYLPVTNATMMVSWLAISGFPLLSGFFSKDEILGKTWATAALPAPWGKVLWAVRAVTALLTAIYMTRLMVLTFYGAERFGQKPEKDVQKTPHKGPIEGGREEAHANGHGHSFVPHESGWAMKLPLIVLAVGALSAGWVGIPFNNLNIFEKFLSPAIAGAPHYEAAGAEGAAVATQPHLARQSTVERNEAEAGGGSEELALMAVSTIIALIGLGVGWTWFKKNPLWEPPSILQNKYYVDEVYDHTVIEPIKTVSRRFLWGIIDVKVIDGLVNGTANMVRNAGDDLRQIQTGVTRTYAAVIALGGIVVIASFIWFVYSYIQAVAKGG